MSQRIEKLKEFVSHLYNPIPTPGLVPAHQVEAIHRDNAVVDEILAILSESDKPVIQRDQLMTGEYEFREDSRKGGGILVCGNIFICHIPGVKEEISSGFVITEKLNSQSQRIKKLEEELKIYRVGYDALSKREDATKQIKERNYIYQGQCVGMSLEVVTATNLNKALTAEVATLKGENERLRGFIIEHQYQISIEQGIDEGMKCVDCFALMGTDCLSSCDYRTVLAPASPQPPKPEGEG